jgi:[acyl-carrier-protein] S-malonyltransferase
MTKTAWVFPGQGSQAIGMGMDLLDQSVAQARFEQASQQLGWSVVEICQNTDDKVSQTLYTQPCLYVVESILVDLLKAKGQHPDYVAGHSLGEYSALYAAGVLSFADGLRLIQRRAELMSNATEGMMAALLGCDRDQLDTVLAHTPEAVLANDNNAGQVVISGTVEGVEAVLSQVKSKRAVKLNVSGAFHSPLMADAAAQFQPLLDQVTFADAQLPVLSNVEPTPATAGSVLKEQLSQQMTGSVRWREISLQLPECGVTRVVEVGPGKVLTGIIKRTCPTLELGNVGTLADITE